MRTARTTAKIEQAAQRILEATSVAKAPVPVERIAAARNIGIAFDDLGDDISGMLYRRGGTCVMVINQEHHHHRQRFSIAHEVAHAELHDAATYLDGRATIRFRDGKSATGTDVEEREANRFAAALLMPADWVRDRFMRMVTGRRAIDETQAIAKLAVEFDVSEQAMQYRLANLNLIDPA
jgi:Zn-dependent peptidase ImmA (M78 family)